MTGLSQILYLADNMTGNRLIEISDKIYTQIRWNIHNQIWGEHMLLAECAIDVTA